MVEETYEIYFFDEITLQSLSFIVCLTFVNVYVMLWYYMYVYEAIKATTYGYWRYSYGLKITQKTNFHISEYIKSDSLPNKKRSPH